MMPAVVVSGFGRCGTTMTMHMLRAGGVAWVPGLSEMFAERGPGPDAEPMPGRAVKRLAGSVAEVRRPASEVRVVWLDRADEAARAESWVRLMGAAGQPVSLEDARRAVAHNAACRADALTACRRLGPVLVLTFEAVLADPLSAAERLAHHVAPLPFSVHPAHRVVRTKEVV